MKRLFVLGLYYALSTFGSSIHAQPVTPPDQQQTMVVRPIEKLPPARRVFALDLDRDGSDELLIAHNTQLSAHRWLSQEGGWQPVWKIDGPGVAQLVLMDHSERAVWIAWGMGKGKMVAPITLGKADSLSGEHREVWQYQGARSQTVSLDWVNIDPSQPPQLLLAHFINKYHTRRVLLSGFGQDKLSENASAEIRMGTSWLMGDLDGKPGLEEIVGRVYGDEKGEYGDLTIYPHFAEAKSFAQGEVIPTQRGVKTLLFTQGPMGRRALFISDGWVAAYGAKARATLKRLSWQKGRATLEQLATSPDEFTFFELWERSDARGASFIFAYGNKGISLLTPTDDGPWQITRLLSTPPIVNAAVGYTHSDQQWWAFTPHETEAQAHRLTLPNSHQ